MSKGGDLSVENEWKSLYIKKEGFFSRGKSLQCQSEFFKLLKKNVLILIEKPKEFRSIGTLRYQKS